MTDDEFLCAFEKCRLARKDWTHEAHVRMAWLYATRVPADGAVFDRVRAGIKRLNAAFVRRQQILCMRGPVPTKDKDPRGLDGYHETITTAFVTLIAARAREGEDFVTFRDRNPDLLDRKLTALLRHYTPDRLFSAPARAAFLAPDLAPLPDRA